MCNLHQRIAAEDARLKSFKPIPPHDNKFTPLPESSAICKLTAMKLGSMSMPAFYWVLDAKGQLAFECCPLPDPAESRPPIRLRRGLPHRKSQGKGPL
jgi:hypothetical protein